MPEEFFTPESMLTLAGATLMTTIITNSIQYALNWNPKWFGLVIAMIIAMIGVTLTPEPKFINYLMGIINGFFIYANSTGIMQMIGTTGDEPAPVPMAEDKKPQKRFLSKWY